MDRNPQSQISYYPCVIAEKMEALRNLPKFP